MKPEPRPHLLLRLSLAAVWMITAAVSALEWRGQSRQLLELAEVTDVAAQEVLIWSGVAIDVILGLAFVFRPARTTYLAALAMTACMTLLATLLLPGLWLHPLGPLTKNITMAAALWLLASESR